MTILYLVRHGFTDALGQRICGNLPGVHLNQTGKAQAEKVASFLCGKPIKAIFSSPLERAVETALPLSKAIGLPVTPQEFLRPLNFGSFQGMGEERNDSPLWKLFFEHPAQVKFPGGESIQEAQLRITTGLENLSAGFGDDDQIVCVSHCEVLRSAIAFVLGMPIDLYQRLTLDPASISCIAWHRDHQQLLLLNHQPI